MRIKELRIKNFRCIEDATIRVSDLTALVGRNGAGKSSALRAVRLFYEGKPNISPQDFFNENTSREIEIKISFAALSDQASELFSPYLDTSGDLSVTRVLNQNSDRYHGARPQNQDFISIRAHDKAMPLRREYNELRETEKYSDLPSVRSEKEAREAMKEWEENHPDELDQMRDDGQFFGFRGVGKGYLGRFTRFLMVPAVRDVSEDTEDKRGSVITELMDLVVRNALSARTEVKKLQKEVQDKHEDIMDPSDLDELKNLEEQLTISLEKLAPGAGVELDWQEGEVELPMPEALVRLVEDGYAAKAGRSGHGLQRAFIVSMLQQLALARESENYEPEKQNGAQDQQDEVALPHLVLAIEEPELYQHPSRQRHLADIFASLARGKVSGVAESTQVIYSTHSPLFVKMDRLGEVRLFRKNTVGEDKPKATKVVSTTLDSVAENLWVANGKPGSKWTGTSLKPRLRAIMTPWMREGFFADKVVLVEGPSDRAALVGMSLHMNEDFQSAGISVIPCKGKQNLDRPFLIFTHLGIKTFVLWDSDKGEPKADPENNRYLLRLLGEDEEDWPCRQQRTYACFQNNLESYLEERMGPELYDRLVRGCQQEFGMDKKDHVLKNPTVMEKVITQGIDTGADLPKLEAIVTAIMGN